jgi:hypothetical protein
MTQFTPLEKETTKKYVTMNALALMVFVLFFLTSTLVHADHLASHTLHVDQQECYICHQGVDTPPELPQVKSPLIVSYRNSTYETLKLEFKVNYFVKPQLRAPPIFQ